MFDSESTNRHTITARAQEYINLRKKCPSIVDVNGKVIPRKRDLRLAVNNFGECLLEWAKDPINSGINDGYGSELFIFSILRALYYSFSVHPTPPYLDNIGWSDHFPSADIMLGNNCGECFMPALLVATAVRYKSADGYHPLIGRNVVSISGYAVFAGQSYRSVLLDASTSPDYDEAVSYYADRVDDRVMKKIDREVSKI